MLPELIHEAENRRELRIWSAGCATGEEPYSLAMLVTSLLGDEVEGWNVRIFATDLDGDAVAYARRGVYPPAALTDVPEHMLERHFVRLTNSYEINKQTRGLVVFGEHDLGQRAPFPRIDLVLCRNVMIYFTSELQRRALQLFAYSLRDRGYLVLDKAESVSPLSDSFAVENPRLKIFRRTGDRTLIPPTRFETPASIAPARSQASHHNTPRERAVGTLVQRDQGERGRVVAERADRLLQQLPIGVVVLDRQYDIQLINSAARLLFGIHTAALGDDFIHLVQNADLLPLRTTIDAAFRNESEQDVYPVETTATVMGEPRFLEISCHPQRSAAEDQPPEMAVIMVRDVTEAETTRRERAIADAHRVQEAERRAEQVAHLSATNRQLLAANQELTAENTDLRSVNDQLLLSNEEVQAATEEVETLNEEMQATNEELETLNEELQATVEELNTTNDDLQARSIELQDQAIRLEDQRRASEADRARLEAMLASMADAVLVISPSGNVILTNTSYVRQFGDHLDFVPESEQGDPLAIEERPRARALRGESFTMQFTLPTADGDRRWFEANGRPIRVDDDQQGSIIVIRDITERSLRRLQDEFLAIASHELRTPLTALRGALQMQTRYLPPDNDRVRHYAEIALGQVQRMTTQVDDLMDVARLQSGQLNLEREQLNLVPLVRRVVDSAQVITQGQIIALDTADDSLFTVGDAIRIEQVLLNLLTNAITYAPDTDRIDVRLRHASDTAEIQVQDYGDGIEPDQLPTIFSRFGQVHRSNRSSRGGLGLGLFIAKEIVTAHGGHIDIDSNVGDGSTFTVHLPLVNRS